MDALIGVLIRILEAMFVVGVIGSAVVWVLTTVEDVANMFSTDVEEQSAIDGDTHRSE